MTFLIFSIISLVSRVVSIIPRQNFFFPQSSSENSALYQISQQPNLTMAAQETITSSCPDGIIVSMNAFIDPSNRGAFIKHASAVAKEFRKHENNLFTEISVNPTDAGHVRVVHGWTKDSEWFHTVRILLQVNGCVLTKVLRRSWRSLGSRTFSLRQRRCGRNLVCIPHFREFSEMANCV